MIVSLIRGIHYAIIIAVAVAPFVSWPIYRNTAEIFLIYLFLQYITGYEKCGLTVLEYLVMGEKYAEGFLYRIINPLIKIPENYFNKYLILVHILYIYLLSDSLPLSFN